jgi:O-antigen ligase
VTVGRVGITSSESIGSMFFVWLVALAAGQGLYNQSLRTPVRLALLAAGALTLVRSLVLAFSWASGWLPPLVALAVVVFVQHPRTAISGSLLAIAPAMLFGNHVLSALLEGETYSWMTRLEAIRVILQVIAHNPWLGFGPANYHHYTLLFPFLGWWAQFSTHNNYLDLVAQTGLVGLLAFFWFVAEVFLLALRLRSRVPAGFARAYVIGVMGGLAGSLVAALLADWIIPFAYNIGLRGFRSSVLFWFFLGGLLAIKRMSAAPGPVGAAASHAELLFPAAGPLKAAVPLASKEMS